MLRGTFFAINVPVGVIRAQPSRELAEKLEKEEQARIANQKSLLGPEGLAKKRKELEDALAQNSVPIPSDLLKSFPSPDIHNISWIPVETFQDGKNLASSQDCTVKSELDQYIQSDGAELPFFVQFDHIQVCNVPLVPNHLLKKMAVRVYRGARPGLFGDVARSSASVRHRPIPSLRCIQSFSDSSRFIIWLYSRY